MKLNPIGIAVPFFFLLMLVEFLISLRYRRKVYRLNDSVADLTCGMGDQIIGLFFKGVTAAIYLAVQSHAALFEMPVESVWTWVVGMLGVDFFFYWYHRFSHRVHWAWATHAVHHHSEEYNLAVALRQPWFSQLYAWAFYLPLALLGVPPEVWVTSFSFNLLYQFWIHTRLIGKLGAFGWVMNTPSHHRVHHGTNPDYIDTNYAGILIIWDRMFGTFVPEDEEPLYGTLDPLQSWNPLWANVGPFVKIHQIASGRSSWWEKLMAWWGPPGWTPSGEVHPPFPSPQRGYDAGSAANIGPYVVAHLLPVAAVLGLALTFEKQAPVISLVLAAAYVLWSGMVWSGLFEQRRWAVPLEIGRLLSVCVGAAAWAVGQPVLGIVLGVAVVLMSLASLSWVWSHRRLLVAEG